MQSAFDVPPINMHRFWENPEEDDDFSREQDDFMRSRQKPSANFTRRQGRPAAKPEIVEVDPTPFETIPIEIITHDTDNNDSQTDRIDISGNLPPMSLPGVSSSSSHTFAPPRPKKSLFARKQEQKRLAAPMDPSSRSNGTESVASEPEIGILSDPVERDVVSFSNHISETKAFEATETGFPESEKIEFPTLLDMQEVKSGANSGSGNSGHLPHAHVFYSSSRDRLEPTYTMQVDSDEETQLQTSHLGEPHITFESGPPSSEIDTMLEEVSRENDASVSKMSTEEVERLQQELAAHLNPKFIQMLKDRGLQKAMTSKSSHTPATSSSNNAESLTQTGASRAFAERKPKQNTQTERVVTSTGTYSLPPTKSRKKRTNNFLAEMERKKREWMLPIQPSGIHSSRTAGSSTSKPNGDHTSSLLETERTHMSAEWYRFDFEGQLLSYPSPSGNVPLEEVSKLKELNMLLHHGDDPTDPGYTLDELIHLSRSSHPSQRISALRALGCIVFKAKRAHYSLPSLRLPTFGTFEAFPNNLFLSHLIQTLNLPLVLRIALDDSSNTQIVETLYGLHALLCSDSDDAVAALAGLPANCIYTFPLNPRDEDNVSQSIKDWDDKSDSERCEVDLVLALLQTGLLSRLRYILESKSSSISTTLILQIMQRCARHSAEACEHFQQCPGLLPLFKKLVTSTSVSLAEPDSNLVQIIRLVKLACQGSRKTCESAIQIGLVSACFKFLCTPSSLANDPVDNRENAIACTIETLGLIETCLRYGLFRSPTVNILPLLLDLVSDLKSLDAGSRKLLVQSAAWRLLSSMVPLARDIPEGEEIPTFVVLWSHISPMVPQALASLRQFDRIYESHGMTSDADSALSSILEFLASYFRQLELHPPRSFEEDKTQVTFISQTAIAPFLISSKYFSNLVLKLSSQNSWRSTPSELLYFNVVPAAAYTVNLTSHPAWSWKAQRVQKSPGGGTPARPSEQTFSLLLSPNVIGSTILHQASVLLGALRVVDSINVHDSWLSASLTASEISNPLTAILEHYSSWAMQSSGSAGSIYATRSLHLMAYQIASLLYKSSIVAQESALICLAHLLPGDELLAERLLLRIATYYTPSSEEEVPLDQSLAKRLQVAPGVLAYLLAVIKDGLVGSSPRSSRLFYLSEEDHPVDRESLLQDVEGSAQPLGKHWVYSVFSHYARHRAIEEDELAQKKQRAKSDAIQRGVEAYLEAQQSAPGTSENPEIEIQLDGNMELVGDYEDLESKRALKVGVSLIRDSLRFALNVESSNTGFAVKMKRHVKLYSLMQVFTLGPNFFMDEEIATLLRALMGKYLERGWELCALQPSVIINTTVVEKVVELWANESFGDTNIGAAVALWIAAGADLSSSEIASSGQSSELKALDSAIWPHFVTHWHLLPEPPKSLQKHYFQENIVHRTLVAEYLLLAVCSPHTLQMRKNWNFWYRFIIFQLSKFFTSSHPENVNGWMRLNALQSLLSDLGSLELKDLAVLMADIFIATEAQLESSDAMGTTPIEKVLVERPEAPIVETLLSELRKVFSP